MPHKTKRGELLIGATKLAEVIDVAVADDLQEEDTSIIGRSAENFAPRVDVDYGPDTITVNCYVDLTDPAQTALVRGAKVTFVDRPLGVGTGLPERTYAEVTLMTRNEGTRAFAGYWKVAFVLKQSGDYTEILQP